LKTEKILALSNYLAMSPKSYNEVAQFLVMNTFSDDGATCLIMTELVETGLVCAIGGFGWSPPEYESFTDMPIQTKLPITDSLRSAEIVIVRTSVELFKKYPVASQMVIPGSWETMISIPAHPIGGIAFFSSLNIELDEETELFYIAIGSLLGLYASRLPTALIEVAIATKQKIEIPAVPLTERQLVIAGMLERGFNNSQIGLEIGYSESLVRQETVAIYRKLQVTGRQAMQAIRTLHLSELEEAKE